jgi:hypothetical protein
MKQYDDRLMTPVKARLSDLFFGEFCAVSGPVIYLSNSIQILQWGK